MSDIAEVLNALLRRWWLLVLAVVLGAVAGFGYAAVAAKSYTASCYVVVTAVPTAAGGADDATTSVNFAQAFGRIIEQQDIVGRAAAAIHYQGSADDYGKHIQASTSPNAPLIQVIGTAPDGGDAANYANAAADALVSFANLQTANTNVSLAVLSEATAPSAPSSPRPALDTAVGAAAGLLIGALGTMAQNRSARSNPAEVGADTTTGADGTDPDADGEATSGRGGPQPRDRDPAETLPGTAPATRRSRRSEAGPKPRPEPRRAPEPEPVPPPSGYQASDGDGDGGDDSDDWIAFRDRGRGLWADRLADEAPTLEVPRLPAAFADLPERGRRPEDRNGKPDRAARVDEPGSEGDTDGPTRHRDRDRDGEDRTLSPDHRPQVH